MALNGSKWSIERNASQKRWLRMPVGCQWILHCFWLAASGKKGGRLKLVVSQSSKAPRHPIKHDHILDALGVPTLGSAIFFLAELYSHDGTTLGRIRGHVQFAKGMGQNTRHNWFNCEHELPSSNQSWRLWYLYHCKVCHSDLWIGRNLPAQCSVAGPKKLKHKAGESQCPF